MLTSVELQQRLRKSQPNLRDKFHVKRIDLFGSYARGEATPTSDVDLLVEFSQPIGWEFIDLKEYIEHELGVTVDLVTPAGLRPQLKEKILREVVYV